MNEAATRSRTSLATDRLLPYAAALALGAAVAVQPTLAVAGFGTVTATLLIVMFRRQLIRVFLVALGLLLAGYAFLDRGFAHIGVPPVYLGDVVLALGVVAVALASRGTRVLMPRHSVLWLALGFMTWGAIRTVPYLARDGTDALRDAVVWGYAAFALLVFAILDRNTAEHIRPLYRKLMPFFLLWLPVGALASQLVETPSVPGGDVPFINLKLGDAGVHLAGIAAFALLGLHGRWRAPIAAAQSVAFLVSIGLVASLNRGGMLAASTAALALTVARPSRTWLIPMLLTSLLGGAATLIDPFSRSDLPGGRSASVAQVTANLGSIFSEGPASLEGTKAWRLEWWSAIVDYTVFGPYFWTGKGFGVNLRVDDFVNTSDDSVRAPHNSHLTILARMGVPGLVLWLALLSAFARAVVTAFVRARAGRQEQRSRMLLWVLVYWVAMLVNMSFDPYLESPMGGIWFWSVLGFGLAVATNDDLFAAGAPARTTK
jgi:O-antigen ligase/polysaccharide polymerase Wzy-like membrane protein